MSVNFGQGPAHSSMDASAQNQPQAASSSCLAEIIRACCGSSTTVVRTIKPTETSLGIQNLIDELKAQMSANKEEIKRLSQENLEHKTKIEKLDRLLGEGESKQQADPIVRDEVLPIINNRNAKLAEIEEKEAAAKRAQEEAKLQEALWEIYGQNPKRQIPVQSTHNNINSNGLNFASQRFLDNTNYNYHNNNNTNNSYERFSDNEMDSLLNVNSTNYQIPNNNEMAPLRSRSNLSHKIQKIEAEFKACMPGKNRNVVAWERPGYREQKMLELLRSNNVQTDAEAAKILNGLSTAVQKQIPGLLAN